MLDASQIIWSFKDGGKGKNLANRIRATTKKRDLAVEIGPSSKQEPT